MHPAKKAKLDLEQVQQDFVSSGQTHVQELAQKNESLKQAVDFLMEEHFALTGSGWPDLPLALRHDPTALAQGIAQTRNGHRRIRFPREEIPQEVFSKALCFKNTVNKHSRLARTAF